VHCGHIVLESIPNLFWRN